MDYPAVRDLDYDPVANWTLGLADSTKRQYLRFLKLFCEFTGKDPFQLIRWVKKDRTRVHQKLKEFHHHMAKFNVSPGNKNYGYIALRSFFFHNDYPLGKAPGLLMSQSRFREPRLLRSVEVGDMISCASHIRSKAIISLLAQSGQRIGVLAALRYGAIRRQIEQAISPVIVEVSSGLQNGKDLSANKGKTNYRFAFGKESRNYIIQMINKRRQRGEPIDDDSWLFRCGLKSDQRPGGLFYPKRYEPSERGGPLTPYWFNEVVVRAAKAAGIQSEKMVLKDSTGRPRHFQEVHAHILRLFWKHQMRTGGVTDPDLLNFMMGHTPRYGGAYDVFDQDYVRNEYAKAEPYLTVISRYPRPAGKVSRRKPTPQNPALKRFGPQRVVKEHQLGAYLRSGWRYVTILPSQRILIEKALRTQP